MACWEAIADESVPHVSRSGHGSSSRVLSSSDMTFPAATCPVLESTSTDLVEFPQLYKYGCTTRTPEIRCKGVNRSCDYAKFKVIAAFRSNDIYADENTVAYAVKMGGFGRMSEIFSPDEDSDKAEIVRRFLKAGKVLY